MHNIYTLNSPFLLLQISLRNFVGQKRFSFVAQGFQIEQQERSAVAASPSRGV